MNVPSGIIGSKSNYFTFFKLKWQNSHIFITQAKLFNT